MAEAWFGPGNGLLEYVYVLLVYGGLFLVMRFAYPRLELNFRRTYWLLCFTWAIGTFIGNYLLFLLGVMSFLPWVNNFMHTFIWIGLCLAYLYAAAHRQPLWEQFALFAIFSLIVKAAEHDLLGTWEMNHFFGIPGNRAYIVGWSLMDGLYPLLSLVGLRLVARYVRGVIIPPSLRPLIPERGRAVGSAAQQ